jgi:signal transduction histidine kinase
LQSLADRAAHEIRNPLNGLALNLEVVRSRSVRGGGGGDVASLARFAVAAAGELERAAELVQALLELARPLAAPVDLWSALRPMVVLQHALAVAGANGVEDDGGDAAAVTLKPRGGAALTVATDPLISRIALASALEAVASARTPAHVECSVEAREEKGGQVVAMLLCAAPAPPLDDPVRSTIEGGGVLLEMIPNGMMLFFRAAGRD